MPSRASHKVLEIEDLSIQYRTEYGAFPAVRAATLSVGARESLGIVGESGSGKSTLAMGAMRYLPENGSITGGSVRLRGTDMADLSPAELRKIWGGQVGIVYQNPLSALNPSYTIGRQLREVGTEHLGLGKQEALDLASQTLAQVAMPDPPRVLRSYPHQMSGGMLQRCVIAMALMCRPTLLVLDEPTTALDVTTQAVFLDLVHELKQELEAAIIYITHDLGVVARISDRIAVMYAGEVVEQATTRDLFRRPLHPYTLSLLGCVPHFDLRPEMRTLLTIRGVIPRGDRLPPGCVFGPRCAYFGGECAGERSTLVEVEEGHSTACDSWHLLPTPEQRTQAKTRLIRNRRAGAAGHEPLVTVEDVAVTLPASGRAGGGKRGKTWVHAVDGVSAFIEPGETLGIVGESGSGKTTLARALIGLTERTGGEVTLKGSPLEPAVERRSRDAVRGIQMVFQNPDASLNPRHTVGEEIGRPLTLLLGLRGKERQKQVQELLEAVNLPRHYADRFPGELSGGEKQRVAIARACAAQPDLILCDEPISSLDVSVQGTLMNLLMERQAASGTSYLFISHDLSAVGHMSDWIGVMYLGRLMEFGRTRHVMAPPFHPYTEALLSALPQPDPDVAQKEIRLEGSVPSATDVPPGCRFHTRCPRCLGECCRSAEPPWAQIGPCHWIYCHIPPDELAGKQAGLLEVVSGVTGQEVAP